MEYFHTRSRQTLRQNQLNLINTTYQYFEYNHYFERISSHYKLLYKITLYPISEQKDHPIMDSTTESLVTRSLPTIIILQLGFYHRGRESISVLPSSSEIYHNDYHLLPLESHWRKSKGVFESMDRIVRT